MSWEESGTGRGRDTEGRGQDMEVSGPCVAVASHRDYFWHHEWARLGELKALPLLTGWSFKPGSGERLSSGRRVSKVEAYLKMVWRVCPRQPVVSRAELRSLVLNLISSLPGSGLGRVPYLLL